MFDKGTYAIFFYLFFFFSRYKNIKIINANTRNSAPAEMVYALAAPKRANFLTRIPEINMAIALAIPNPINKYTCLRITVNITCSITAKAKNAPPISNTTNTFMYADRETPNTMDNIGHPRMAPPMIMIVEIISAPAKIKPHNFMNLRYSL